VKLSFRLVLLAALLAVVSSSQATGSGLRMACEGADIGARVLINSTFKSECPIDLKVPAGPLKLVVRTQLDTERERVFEQDIGMGENSSKKVEAQLLALRLNATVQDGLEQ